MALFYIKEQLTPGQLSRRVLHFVVVVRRAQQSFSHAIVMCIGWCGSKGTSMFGIFFWWIAEI